MIQRSWKTLDDAGNKIAQTAREIGGYFAEAGLEVTESVGLALRSTATSATKLSRETGEIVAKIPNAARDVGSLALLQANRFINGFSGMREGVSNMIASIGRTADEVLPRAIMGTVASAGDIMLRTGEQAFLGVRNMATAGTTVAAQAGRTLVAVARGTTDATRNALNDIQEFASNIAIDATTRSTDVGIGLALRAMETQSAATTQVLIAANRATNAAASIPGAIANVAKTSFDWSSYQIARAVVQTNRASSDVAYTAKQGLSLMAGRLRGTPAPTQIAVRLPEPQNYRTSIRKENGQYLIASLSMSLFDSLGSPFSNTPVVLFSTPKVSVTNDSGIATFHDVETGKHQIEIHVTGGGVQKSDFIVEPPSDLTLADQKQLDVALPLIQLMVASPQTTTSSNNAIPLYGWIIIILLTTSNIGWGVMIWTRRKPQQ